MRSYIVFFLLVVSLVGFGVLLGLRARPPHQMPAPPPEVAVAPRADAGAASGDAGDAAVTPTTQADTGAAPPRDGPRDGGAVADAGGPAKVVHPRPDERDAAPPVQKKLMDRPLRVIGHGWEVIAPGLVANKGTTPGEGSLYARDGLEVRINTSSKVIDLENALARGGSDEAGADVAIMPLPVFVAAYERLRALSPRIFFVLGWSHGQEAILAFQEDALEALPRNKAVQLVTEQRSPAHFFGLFVLDLEGVPPERVEAVDRGDDAAASVMFAALRQPARGHPAGAASRRFLLTTADADRLIPYVAVAPQALVDAEPDALGALCAGWLEGVDELRRDVPAAARRIASISGAPEALELLALLGREESSSLRENAALAGLSGRGAVNIESLFETAWRLWRGADVLTSPMPEEVPMRSDIIEALVRTGGSMDDDAAGTIAEGEPTARASGPTGQAPRPILIHRIDQQPLDDDLIAARVGFLAGVFRPLHVRVSVAGGGQRANAIVAHAAERFGIPDHRLSVGRRPSGRAAPAIIELLPPQ